MPDEPQSAPRESRPVSPAAAALAAGAVLVTVALWMLVGPLAQDPAYHDFADQRSLWGVPHAGNVLSNAAFCIAGAWGCGVLLVGRGHAWSFMECVHGVFFLGLFCTGVGSAYYHLWPGDATLIWDRLPMTIGFMAFTCLVLAERCSEALARRLLPWLLLAGVLSVAYWGWTGDLRPYVLVQFGPMLALPVVIWRFPGPGTRWLWLTVAFYLAAKLLELSDQQLLAWTHDMISGHTLKHLAAAAGAAMIVAKVSAGDVCFSSAHDERQTGRVHGADAARTAPAHDG